VDQIGTRFFYNQKWFIQGLLFHSPGGNSRPLETQFPKANIEDGDEFILI
jgi:hypothetical protein